jgi:phage terminase small subunit
MSNHSLSIARLTTRQKAFVKYYVLLNDGRAAAIRAGYSVKRAAQEAYELLLHPAVKREVNKARAVQARQYQAEMDAAMQELFHCLTRRGTDLVDPKTGLMLPLHDMPERVNAAMDGYEETVTEGPLGTKVVKKIKLVSKASAIDMAMKIRGAYAPDKHEVKSAVVDLTQLYGVPDGALDPDVIELDPEE